MKSSVVVWLKVNTKRCNHLYQKPMIDAPKAGEATGLSISTAYKILQELVDMNIVQEITGGRRGKI